MWSVRQIDRLQRLPRGGVIISIIACVLVSLPFLYARASRTIIEPQQQRGRVQKQSPNRRRPTTTPGAQALTKGSSRNYSRFKHEDHRRPVARLDCADCHTIPSPFEPDRIAAATKPAAQGYPYHDSCVRCHRQQFFKGAAPPICTVCHTRATPRLTARDMQHFPKRNEQLSAREFPGYFPHSLHQSVIARSDSERQPAPRRTGDWSFARASFRPSAEDTPVQSTDNCATCHQTDERTPVEITVGGQEATFKPEAKGTFKTVPTGHASCFNCHWQSQKPLKDDCAGCHLSPGEYTKRKRAVAIEAALPGVLSPRAVEWFKTWPAGWPRRLSIKFRHETTNHDIGCTTCHINLVQMETLNIPKADVPIATCAPCHISASPVLRKEGGNLTIFSEMSEEAKDKENKTNTCTGCHTTLIGRERPPCSHYLVLGQQCEQ